jgi:predicted NACHT family NTPase
LWINLATEILGSVILLIIVDHRIRRDDMRLIRGLTGRLNSVFWIVFSTRAAVVRYCQVLDAALYKVRPETYFHRKSLDNLEETHHEGFVLKGDARSGKTTVLQHIAMRLAREALAKPHEPDGETAKPKEPRVPVLIPGRDLLPQPLSESIRTHMNAYSWMSRSRIESLMQAGRLTLLLDGVDESPNRDRLKAELQKFRAKFPGNQVIVSARPYIQFSLDELPTISIEPMTPAEIEEFLKL